MAGRGKDGKVRFGLIGCGEIAVHSAHALHLAAEVCQLAGVADVVEPLARDLGQKYHVPHFTDAAELLKRDDVDAVVISTPHGLHAPLTIQAARAGKHVACEKPIACTLEQADAMLGACREAGVLLSVCYVTRFGPGMAHLKELVHAGALGRLIRYRCQIFYDKPEHYWTGGYTRRASGNWRRSRELSGGGVLLMNGSHSLDRIHWLTGLEPVRLYAEGDTHDTQVEVEDNISVVTRYSNGAIGSVDAMSCARGQAPGGNRLFGTLGQLDMTRGCRLFTRRTDLPGIQPNAWAELRPARTAHRGDSRAAFLSQFAQAVLSGAPKGPIPGEEGRQVLAFCVAAYESALRRQVVEFRPGTWEPILSR